MLTRLESQKVKAKLLQKAKRKAKKPIKLKEAYETLAKSAGYSSWREQKKAIDESSFFSKNKQGSTLHLWFHQYDEAKNYLENNGGYLLPYEKDFVIINENDLISFGIMKNDPDLKKVGNDFVKPEDQIAIKQIFKKLRNNN